MRIKDINWPFQTLKYSLRNIMAHYTHNICWNIRYIVDTDAVEGVFWCLKWHFPVPKARALGKGRYRDMKFVWYQQHRCPQYTWYFNIYYAYNEQWCCRKNILTFEVVSLCPNARALGKGRFHFNVWSIRGISNI